MTLSIRPATVAYQPSVRDLVNIYLEVFEIVMCFAVAFVKELFSLTVRTVRFCQAWQEWRGMYRFGPVEVGFNLQQQYDDLETVWVTIAWDSYNHGTSLYWCRCDQWVRIGW